MFHIYYAFYNELEPYAHKSTPPAKFNTLLLMLDGQLSYTFDQKILYVSKGEMLFIPAGLPRHYQASHHKVQRSYSIHFTTDHLLGLPLLSECKTFKHIVRNHHYFKQRFDTIYQHWIGKFPYYEQSIHGILLEILADLNREMSSPLPTKKHALVSEMQQYIILHFREALRIEQLAKHFDRHPNYISTLFHEITGCSPIDYLHDIRIASAKELLLNTSMSIAQVSDYLGYCDPAYFNRVYRKKLGHPPSALFKNR